MRTSCIFMARMATIIVLILMTGTACLISGCAKADDHQVTQATTREIVDMAGRRVVIPVQVKKVYAASNNVCADLYAIAPDRLVGWNYTLQPDVKRYIDGKYYNLPVIGAKSGSGGTSNYENIIKMQPDIIICSNEDEVFSPDEIQKKLNIPVVVVDVSLQSIDKVYLFLGDCLGEGTRGKQLADYARKTLDEIGNIVKEIPADQRVRVYYAEGVKGLQTDISGNVHTEVLDFIGGENVATIAEMKTGSMVGVSMEQVMNWNPDVILIGATAAKGDFYSNIYSDASWQNIRAVKERKVYKIPALPFNWFDRPPSHARIMGVKWLAQLLYPQYVKRDHVQDMKEFYTLFYHRTLTDQEIQEIVKDAGE